MKALLLVALLLTVPVSADAFLFPVRVHVDVTVVGTVTLPDREVEITGGWFLTGTGEAWITLPSEFFPFGTGVSFVATRPGGVSASGFSALEETLAGPIDSLVGLTLSTPDWELSFAEIGPGVRADVEVDPVSRTARFSGSLSPDSEFGGGVVIGSEFGTFRGDASFSGFATAIPEPGVMVLMLASWLLLSTTAVFRRIG